MKTLHFKNNFHVQQLTETSQANNALTEEINCVSNMIFERSRVMCTDVKSRYIGLTLLFARYFVTKQNMTKIKATAHFQLPLLVHQLNFR